MTVQMTITEAENYPQHQVTALRQKIRLWLLSMLRLWLLSMLLVWSSNKKPVVTLNDAMD